MISRFLTTSIPDWVPKSAALVAAYLAAMLVLTFWMPVWHDADVGFFQWLSASHSSDLSPEISIVDVRSWDTANIPSDRLSLAAFLDRLANSDQRPKAVIFDITFGPCQSMPCGDPMESARATLIESLDLAAKAKIPVYATQEVPVDANDNPAGPVAPYDPVIYSHLAGAGHSGFTIMPGSGFLFYRVCYAPAGGLNQDVWSLVSRVLPEFDPSLGCDTEHRPVLVGAAEPNAAPALYSITKTAPFPVGADFSNKYVIVGTLHDDRPRYADRSGPELLAWALSDALLRQSSIISMQAYDEARPQNGMLLVLTPAFSAVTVLAFTSSFYLAKRLKLRRGRRFLPWLAALIAFGTSAVVFAAFEYTMLMSHQVQPQVTLISIGMLLAAALCGVRGTQVELAGTSGIDAAPSETFDYDVFISYAHEDGAWVSENVYVPLRDATLPDGRKLSVFFDTSTIRAGTA